MPVLVYDLQALVGRRAGRQAEFRPIRREVAFKVRIAAVLDDRDEPSRVALRSGGDVIGGLQLGGAVPAHRTVARDFGAGRKRGVP